MNNKNGSHLDSIVAFASLDVDGIYRAVAGYNGDRVALDKALNGTDANSRIGRLLNAWQWGRANKAITAADYTKIRYRRIALVPHSRLLSWIMAEHYAGNPITFERFEDSDWYHLEGFRETLQEHNKAHPDLDLDAKRGDWTEEHSMRVYWLTLVKEMDAGAAQMHARRAADKARQIAYSDSQEHDFESYRAVLESIDASRRDLEYWLSLASTDDQKSEAEAMLAKHDAKNRMPDFMAELDRAVEEIDQLFKRIPAGLALDNEVIHELYARRDRLYDLFMVLNEAPSEE